MGKSCIMHSSRVGLLKEERDESAYFGLTNSETEPPVASRTRAYVEAEKTRMLMLPGKGEKPEASATSPPLVEGLGFRV